MGRCVLRQELAAAEPTPFAWTITLVSREVSADLKRAVREQHQLFKASTILIEDKASGTQLNQDLIEEGLSRVRAVNSEGDKIMRLHAQTATIENAFVHLPTSAPWLADYVHELTVFPNGRHDDQVDSTAQALAWTKQRPPGWGVFELWRQEAERTHGLNVVTPMVRCWV